MITIINLILIIVVSWCLIKKANYLQFIIYTLPIAFNYTPLVFIQFANIEISQFQYGIEKLNYCILAWNVGFTFQIFIDKITIREKHKKLKIGSSKSEIKQSEIVSFFAICLSINVIVNNIYNLSFILEDGYHAIYTKDADLLLKTTTIFPLYVWFNSLLLAYKINKPKSDGVIPINFKYAIQIYWLSMITFIASGSRSTMVYILLTIICIKYSGRALHIFKILVPTISLISVLSIIGMVREGGNITGDINVFNRTIGELAQTTLVFINSIEIMAFDLSRYIHLITTIFPQAIMNWIGVTPPTSLAQEYAELVDPGWAQAGGGFGFSIFAEMYIAGGVGFVLVGSIFIAKMGSYINETFTNKCNSTAMASCAVISFYLCTLARGDSYDIYRPIFFAIIIYYISKLKLITKYRDKT